MDFTDYANEAAALTNARLDTEADLRAYLEPRPWLLERASGADVIPLRGVQIELGALVDASAAGDGAAVVRGLNHLLGEHPIRPRISGHDEKSWHLHVNDESDSVAATLIGEALFGLTLMVTEVGATRLGRCAAAGCGNAFVDVSANRSRRFCSTRCSTRTNVAALRRRKQLAAASAGVVNAVGHSHPTAARTRITADTAQEVGVPLPENANRQAALGNARDGRGDQPQARTGR